MQGGRDGLEARRGLSSSPQAAPHDEALAWPHACARPLTHSCSPPPAISSGVALMVGLVKRLPYPWRSIVDAGVVAAARQKRRLGGATAGHPALSPGSLTRPSQPALSRGPLSRPSQSALSAGPLSWASPGPHPCLTQAPIRLAQLARGLSSVLGRSNARAGMRPAGYHPIGRWRLRHAAPRPLPRARPFEGFQHQVTGLLWGAASIINLYVRALLGSSPGVDPCLPESK